MATTTQPNGNGHYEAVSSEPLITTTAKGFLKTPTESSEYLSAVRSTIAAIMAAIQQRIEKTVRETGEK